MGELSCETVHTVCLILLSYLAIVSKCINNTCKSFVIHCIHTMTILTLIHFCKNSLIFISVTGGVTSIISSPALNLVFTR